MSRPYGAAALAAALFLAVHLPFLPASLEDVDSINFGLAIREFDVARHQPHPPGYPLFIGAARIVGAAIESEEATLALLGIAAGGLAAFTFLALFRALGRRAGTGAEGRPLAAILLAITAPLFFFNAGRPLSDVPGLTVAAGVQAMLLTASTPAALGGAALAAGLASGVRSQVVWLTLPLLVLQWSRLPAGRWRGAALALAGCACGVLLWAVPLVLLSGGPSEYWRALVNQGAEDLSGVVMLWTRPSVRLLAVALWNSFVMPWVLVPTAAVVLVCAAAGGVSLLRTGTGRAIVLTLAAAFGPYLVFDLLFQETATTRYALPLIVPVAYLAVQGAAVVSRRAPAVVTATVAAVNVAVGIQTLAAYSAADAPAFRMLADMRRANQVETSGGPLPVLAMHRRAAFDLRRPIRWAGPAAPQFADWLPSPPKHEWLELVRYWDRGGRAPIWFVADPLRSDLALVAPAAARRYAWGFDESALLGGVRPDEMDWYRFDRPSWYLVEGWALTPETAGVAKEDRRGPGLAPIEGRIRRFAGETTLMLGGRNLAGPAARMRVTLDGRPLDEETIEPGFFLRMTTLPAGALAGDGDYAVIGVSADSEQIAIEQFDAQPAGHVVFGFGDGWHEQEYDPATGKRWRWSSDRAVLRVRSPRQALVLSLAGEIEAAGASRVVVRSGGRVLMDAEIESPFSIAVPIPADALGPEETALTIETSEWYVPAEQRWRSSPDRRRLGLKVYESRIVAEGGLIPAF